MQDVSGRAATPKHQQVREYLESLIEDLEPRAGLPSERDLSQRFGVARMTVRQAMDALVRSGAVYRVQGAGTFKSPERIDQPLVLTSFTQDMQARGLRPGSKTIAQGLEPATVPVARRLQVEVGAPVIRLERLRTADDEPMALERCFLDAKRVPGLAEEPLGDVSLYATLRERYGVTLDSASQTVQATVCDEDEAALLGVEPGSAAFLFERISKDARGQVVEYVKSVYRGDRYQLRMALKLP